MLIRTLYALLITLSASFSAHTTEQQSITLQKGWNLIGFPFTPTQTPQELLQLAPSIESIWHYQNDDWSSYQVSDGVIISNSLNKFYGGKGYWLHLGGSQSSVTIQFDSSDSLSEINLSADWNMIGLSEEHLNIERLIDSTNIESIWSWNDEYWSSYNKSVPQFLNSLQNLQIGKGYYVYHPSGGAFIISPPSSYNLSENESTVASIIPSVDSTGTTYQYSISGGVDQEYFEMNQETGDLSFKVAPDYENPHDQGGIASDNNYEVEVTILYSIGIIETQYLSVRIIDQHENIAPTASHEFFTVLENNILHGALNAHDKDNDILNFTISYDPVLGSIEITDDKLGLFIYTPSSSVIGTDIFKYTIGDGTVTSEEITVTIEISPTSHFGSDTDILEIL